MENIKWDQAKLEEHIKNQTEESLHLDYKAAGSLAKNDGQKKIEITKDVSAMANSDGGLIIYGIKETKDKKYAEKLDPIDRTEITKEWLEDIISNIQPQFQV